MVQGLWDDVEKVVVLEREHACVAVSSDGSMVGVWILDAREAGGNSQLQLNFTE
jgi:hypothetical protein